MARLTDYIPYIETGFFGEGPISAEGFAGVRPHVSGIATAGNQAAIFAPTPQVSAEGKVSTLGVVDMPTLSAEGYSGTLLLVDVPTLKATGTGQNHCFIEAVLSAPSSNGVAASRDGYSGFPSLSASGSGLCGIETPFSGNDTDYELLALLAHEDPAIVALADSITQANVESQIVFDIWQWVTANIAYTTDTSLTGMEEFHLCPMATVELGAGDCEDGAILMHALMLAKGVDPRNLRTAWGVINQGSGDEGHVWTMYRRPSDGRWLVLEWTSGSMSASSIYEAPTLQAKSDEYLFIYRYAYWHALVEFNGLTSEFTFAWNEGGASLPPLEVFGHTTITASAGAVLPNLEATGATGATGSVEFDLAAQVHAYAGHHATGSVKVSAVASGHTGCRGRLSVSSIVAAISHRNNASGSVRIRPAASGRATRHVKATGSARTARFKGAASGRQELTATGHIVLPATRIRGGIMPGGLGSGGVELPGFHAQAQAFPDLVASASLQLPALNVATMASHDNRFDNMMLRYERWPSA